MPHSSTPPLPNIARAALLAGAYGAGALATWMVSQPFWFLPAGWRLGWLWLAPVRLWPWLYGAEVAVWVVAPRGDPNSKVTFDSMLVPLVYIGAVAAARWMRERHPGQGEMPWLIGTGLTAAAINSLVVATFQGAPAGVSSALWKAAPYWIGDVVGCLTLAPLLLVMADALRPAKQGGPGEHPSSWLVWALLPSAAYWLLLRFAEPASLAAAPVLASAGVLMLAWRFGRRATAVCMLPLGASMFAASRYGMTRLPGFELQLIVALAAMAGLLLGEAMDRFRQRMIALREAYDEVSSHRDALLHVTGRLVGVQEDERNRVGRELHDGLGQTLSAARTRLSIVRRLMHESVPSAPGLAELDALMRVAQDELHTAIESLQPSDIARLGLERALRLGPVASLLNDAGIGFDLAYEVDGDLPPEAAHGVYRICQEAANNAAKAQLARRFGVDLRCRREGENQRVELVVSDDAGELPSRSDGSGRGLQNIRDRAQLLNATYSFDPINGAIRHSLQFAVTTS